MAGEIPANERGIALIGKCIQVIEPSTENIDDKIGLVIGYQKRFDDSDPRHKLYYPNSGTVTEIWMEDNASNYRIVDKKIFPDWKTDRHARRISVKVKVQDKDEYEYFEAFLVKGDGPNKFQYIDPSDDSFTDINLFSDQSWRFIAPGSWVVPVTGRPPIKSWSYSPVGEPGPDPPPFQFR